MAKTATRKHTALEKSLQNAKDNARQLGAVLAHQQQSQHSSDTVDTATKRPSMRYSISEEEENQIYFAYHLANLLSDVSNAGADRRAEINMESFSVVMMLLKDKLKMDLSSLGR